MEIRRSPINQTPIRRRDDLFAMWRDYLRPEAYLVRTLWMLFLDRHHRPIGPTLTLDDVPDGPWAYQVPELVEVCRHVLDGPGLAASVSLVLTRPGGVPWTVSDRAWGRFLIKAANEVGGTVWPVLLGHQDTLQEFRLTREQ